MTHSLNLADIRRNYSRQALSESHVHADPLQQFQDWMAEALTAQVLEPTGMVLSTVNELGRPSARVVLLKGLEEGRFLFYTNYESRKGRDLLARPYAALTFFWPELERQVRVEGRVDRVAENLSDTYFASRPRGSQIGAWASPQSQVIGSREVLEAKTAELEARFQAAATIPRPANWGGFGLIPDYLEFWQGRPNRLHDRITFRRESETGAWELSRLAP